MAGQRITSKFKLAKIGLKLRQSGDHVMVHSIDDFSSFTPTHQRALEDLRVGDILVSARACGHVYRPRLLKEAVEAISNQRNRPIFLEFFRPSTRRTTIRLGKITKKQSMKKKASKQNGSGSSGKKKASKQNGGAGSSGKTNSSQQNGVGASAKRKRDDPAFPSILFSTGGSVSVSDHWRSKSYGSKCAKSRGSEWICRYAGSCEFSFSAEDYKKNKKCLYPKREKTFRSKAGWDSFGEPIEGRGSQPTVHFVYEALLSGKINCEDDVDANVLWAMVNLITPDPNVFDAPLIRVVVHPPKLSRAATKRRRGWMQKGTPQKETGTQNIEAFSLKFDVYFTRMIFYLIAFEPVKIIMMALRNGPSAPSPILELDDYPQTFTSSRQRDEVKKTSFTLGALLRNQEHEGYRSISQPDAIELKLKEYQKQTVAWMHDREFSSGGLNNYYWEERKWLDSVGEDDAFYYMPSAGELRLERPPMVRGGLLCEEMGLGKSLEVVCTIMLDKQKCQNENIIVADGWVENLYRCNTTLIVAPLTLISQWEQEIRKSLKNPDGLRIHVHEEKIHGRCKLHRDGPRECPPGMCLLGASGHKFQRLEKLANCADIVLTSYKMLQTDRTSLAKIHWRRIILDEMQEIRSSTTVLAVACKKLSSDFRWMVSGTPLYTSLDDLNGELNFLGVTPFCLNDATDGFWGQRIRRPWDNQDPDSLKLLHTLLDGIMMRHSKSQNTLDGESILALPSSSSEYVGIDFIGEESLEERGEMMSREGKANLFITKALELLANNFVSEYFVGDAFLELSASASADRMQRHTRTILRLMRLACTSVSLLNGGAGCTQLLNIVDRILRAQLGEETIIGADDGYGHGFQDTIVNTVEDIPVVSPQDALNILMRSRAITQSRADVQAGMIRDGNTHQGQYDTRRVYAMKSILEKACESIVQNIHFGRILKQKKFVVRLRWQNAFERITNGYYFARNHISPKSKNIRARMEPWSKQVDVYDRLKEKCEYMESKFGAMDADGLKYVYGKAKGASDLDVDNMDRKQLISKLMEPLNRDVNEAEKAIEKLSLPGWRHKVGDRLWRGVFIANDFAESRKDRDESIIKALFKALNQAVEDNRPLRIITEKQSQLTQLLVTYSDNLKKAHFDSTVPEVQKVGAAAWFWSRLTRAKRDAHKMNNLYHHNRLNIARMSQSISEAAEKASQMKPYISKMLWAIGAGHGTSSSDSVEQNGFSNLQKIMEGDTSATCAICYGPVKRPTFTRCVHLACAECICSWLQAAPMLDEETRRRAEARQRAMRQGAVAIAREKYAPCMLCRQPFSASQLVCVDTSLSEQENKTAVEEPKTISIRDILQEHRSKNTAGPIFTSACSKEEVDVIGRSLGEVNARRIGRFPALSLEFVTALRLATGIEAPSKASSSNPLRRSPKVRKVLQMIHSCSAKNEKVVVFSQYVTTIKHLSFVLVEEDIPHTKIVRGDNAAFQKSAVATFTTQRACKVFLLHAGAAAAGLTLTAAQNVILLEPFVKAGDEKQAFARCHRMGQTKHVNTYVLYMKHSIEERMLAYRKQENQFAEDANDLSVLSSCDAEVVNRTKLQFLLGAQSQ
jgi:SNF2 family DNA or RNA helicase